MVKKTIPTKASVRKTHGGQLKLVFYLSFFCVQNLRNRPKKEKRMFLLLCD